MPRFKPLDYSPRFLTRQLFPGTFEYALTICSITRSSCPRSTPVLP